MGAIPRPVGARGSARALPALLAVAVAVLAPRGLALANGGVIQLSRAPAGPYAITVQTSPSPIQTGSVDVSVLVQRAESEDLVQDARVQVTAQPAGQPEQARAYEATHDQATNKLFYAAGVDLPTPGRWRITARVQGALGDGAANFEIEASQAGPLDNPLLLLLFVGMPAFLAAVWLARRRTRRTARPAPRRGQP